LARLAEIIHAGGAPAVLQLTHAGSRSFRKDPRQERVGPSPVALVPGPLPRTMTEGEIRQAVEDFASAGRRAMAAGFDGVEVHAAHYYLLSEFLSPYTNRREDAWGGSREGRSRLTVETIKAVRKAVGDDSLLLCRMHAVEFMEGGLSTEDACSFARTFAEAGVDLLNASGVGHASLETRDGHAYLGTRSALPRSMPAGAFMPYTARLREGLGIPVIAVGKLAAEPGLARRIVESGQADLVAIARQLIADPETGTKLLAGRDENIRRCEECLACFAAIQKGMIACPANPSL
ncbi:MAG TPA: NADH:flavin oxidoreductase, partial [Holophaga sp.]|nr:NADH:flavin oxidoreductase [Holophaga sp.]